MEEVKKRALRTSLVVLCENLDLTEVLVRLEAQEILRKVQIQEIEAAGTDYKRNLKLIDTISKSRSETFQRFLEVLNDTNQGHLSEIIENNLVTGQTQGTSRYASNELNKTPESIDLKSLKEAQAALKDFYLINFKKVNPFSLPFTFDIENTWVSLSLMKNWGKMEKLNGDEEETDDDEIDEDEEDVDELYEEIEGRQGERYEKMRIENHCTLVEEAFNNGKRFLIIEGRAASGKTSLMRRIAYDWATGKLDGYSYVFYAEFRNVQKKEFLTIADLIHDGFNNMLENNFERLIHQIKNQKFCKDNPILVLLDGFDEAQVKVPCIELSNILAKRGLRKPLSLDVIVSTRPGPLSKHLERRDILNSATVLGFDTKEQKMAYIRAHFQGAAESRKKNCKVSGKKVSEVEKCLEESPGLNAIAETPLFLVFICLVYDKIKKKTIFELYRCIIWWLIGRYQYDNPMENVPLLFGFKLAATKKENWRIIQDHYLEFPLLCNLGIMAFELYDKTIFSEEDDLKKYEFGDIIIKTGLLRQEEKCVDLRTITQIVFPHRTIQEFLAAGMFYFWPEKNAINDKLTEKLFKKDITIYNFESHSNAGMMEIEKFMWRAALSFDKNIWSCIETRLQNYVSLSLDLSVVLTQKESVEHLNQILLKCSNVKHLCVYSSVNVIVTDRIDFSAMNSITTLIIDGSHMIVVKIIALEGTDWTSARLFDLPKNNMLLNACISATEFQNARCFTTTMHYLFEIATKCEFIGQDNIVYFDSLEQGYISYIFTAPYVKYWLPLILSPEYRSRLNSVEAVLQCLSCAAALTISGKKGKNANFDLQFPVLNLESLHLRCCYFSEAPLNFNKLKNLKSITFTDCKLELPFLDLMVCEICSCCQNFNEITFEDIHLENEDYFEQFFFILKKCVPIEKMEIFWSDYGSKKLWTQKKCHDEETEHFDATKIICDLVRHLQRLKELEVKLNGHGEIATITVNNDEIFAAALPRKNFKFKFS